MDRLQRIIRNIRPLRIPVLESRGACVLRIWHLYDERTQSILVRHTMPTKWEDARQVERSALSVLDLLPPRFRLLGTAVGTRMHLINEGDMLLQVYKGVSHPTNRILFPHQIAEHVFLAESETSWGANSNAPHGGRNAHVSSAMQ